MIKNRESLSMSEAGKYLDLHIDSEAEISKFVKKFVRLTPKSAGEMRFALQGLDIIKMREDHVAKVIDILPESKESINKIFNDVSLDEDETNKILETVKKFE